ncbi:hypothetical protein ACHAXR_012696 [Thalassiosira sp. AJA248-18]
MMASCLPDSTGTAVVVDPHSAMSSTADNNNMAKNTALSSAAAPPSSSLDPMQCDNDNDPSPSPSSSPPMTNPLSGAATAMEASQKMDAENLDDGGSSSVLLPPNAMSEPHHHPRQEGQPPPQKPPPPPSTTNPSSNSTPKKSMAQKEPRKENSWLRTSSPTTNPTNPTASAAASGEALASKLEEPSIIQSSEEKKEGGEKEDGNINNNNNSMQPRSGPKFKSTTTKSHIIVNGSTKKQSGSSNSNSKGPPKVVPKASLLKGGVPPKVVSKASLKGGEGGGGPSPRAAKAGRGGQRASKSLKSLASVRQNYENSKSEETPTDVLPPPPPPPPEDEPNEIQFLATTTTTATLHHPQQTGDDGNTTKSSMDFDKRVTFQGNIIDRIAAAPSNDVVGLEETILGMKKENTLSSSSTSYPTNTASTAASVAASSEAMNGIFPTMAPPMVFPNKPPPTISADLEKSLKKKQKKGKKRKSKSSEGGGEAGGSESSSGVGPKKKKSRGSRKSEGRKGGGKSLDGGATAAGDQSFSKSTTTTINTATADGGHSTTGMKHPRQRPPPSPARLVGPPSNRYIRTLPDPTPLPKQYTITTDEHPQRIVNPLLRLPQFPDGPEPHPIEEVPQAGELWNLANIQYCDPDTYPVSYLARVLGFDLPEEAVGQEFGGVFDPMTARRCVDCVNDVLVAPKSGSFVSRIWKSSEHHGIPSAADADPGSQAAASDTGMYDDLNLTYCDPLWANILSSYRGYNEEDFKDAGKGFYDVLSPQCLEYAKERGVLVKEDGGGGGVSFRFGTEKDEQALRLLAEKCQWKSHPKHDLATCLQSQSHFCIVAETSPSSSSSGDSNSSGGHVPLVAFLQYRFCWYRVEEKKKAGNVSTDKISELVIFIDNIVYDTDGGSEAATASPRDLETAKVLLTSLALVHAARAGIWYGMMDSPSALVPFLTKYFRMSNVSRGRTLAGDNASTVPLVLDTHKCHFKYAILLLEESLKSTVGQKQRVDVSSERMIVNLSSVANASEEMARLRGGVFSNSNIDQARSTKAHVRLMRNSNAQLISVSKASGEEEKEALNPIDPSSIDTSADWNIMRLFPLRDAAPSEAENKDMSDTNEVSDDIFLAELKKKQTKLNSLESSIETTSRGILSKAYKEHTAFATGGRRAEMEREKKILEDYQTVQKRLHDAELAWQAQLDQDMDAVCDVCFDGEVTPDNQIIFCDACNVAVHQRCYGIDQIPSGNYFCHTCTHFEIDKEYLAAKRRDGPPAKLTRHPIICELCPRRQGAFVQVQALVPTKKAKWVHVGCAKWQGMNYVDIELKNKIEDLTVLKTHFKIQGSICTLCKSGIGALHKCRDEECEEWMHLTCARLLGKCSVQHGENCEGFYDPETLDNPPWSLACPKHSEVDPESIREGSLSTEQLVAIAESYPPEPVPLKPFNKMNGGERKEYWSDKENLSEFFEKVIPSLDGAKCSLCEMPADPSIDKRCDTCGVFSHADCADPARGEDATCLVCRFTEQHANKLKLYEEPRCHMCSHPNKSGGPLVRSIARPVSMKAWKGPGKSLAFQRSIFGKDKFCHALCGMWNPLCETTNTEDQDTLIDFSNSAMSNGKDHVSRQYRCSLCGLSSGAKVDCAMRGCVAPGGRRTPFKFHVTCARQAGLEVISDDDFSLKCFNHVDCPYVFRARLEDMREIELNRNSRKTFNASVPMTWSHASTLFHAAVNIMRTLGWAWRWSEWWVELGDNWEPLLEEGQVEAEMTEKELKIVHSDPERRCKDARRSRLSAFGAALRNREYDKEEDDDQEPLERALTAILSTESLVGPLKRREVEFYVTWLALAYRSKSPILGFGDDKAPVAADGFCVHQADGSPKHELGSRPLPGKAKPEKGNFEPRVEETDDFLKTPFPVSPPRRSKKKKAKKGSGEAPDTGDSADPNYDPNDI